MNLIILGAGGHGRVCKENAKATGQFDKISFLDDNFPNENNDIVGKLKQYNDFLDMYPAAFVGIGNNDLRLEWIDRLKIAGFEIVTIVHPKAYVSPSAVIEEGCIVEPMAVINSGAKICRGSIISISSIVDHDCSVSEGCHMAPGTIVKNGATIPARVKIESGTVILK